MVRTLGDPTVDDLKREILRLSEENMKLKAEVNKHKIIFNGALDAIIIFDQEMNFIDVNQAAIGMFNLSEEELKKRSLSDFLGLVPKEAIEQHRKVLAETGTLNDEIMIKLDNGQIKFLEFTAKKRAIGDYDLSIIRDISTKKMLERERTINEQLFKDLFHRAVDGIVIFDETGRFVDANQSFCLSFEIEKERLSFLQFDDFVEEKYEYKLEKLWQVLSDKGRAKGELPVQLSSGAKKIFEFTTTSNILNGYYMSIMRDITEKRNMELKLFKSEERFREIFENAIDAIIIWEETGRILKANQSASRAFELPLDDLIGSKISDFVDKNDSRYEDVKRRYFEEGAIREELLFNMANGQRKELEFTSKMGIIEGQHLTILRNVSDRKKMEKELRESEEKFRKIFDGAMDGIVLFDQNYRIIDANPVAIEILEVPDGQIQNYHLSNIVQSEKYKNFRQLVKMIREHDEVVEEYPFKLLNQKEKILEFSFKRNINKNFGLVTFRDVTERKELEEQLRKSDTLNVVGELAAGIAHEIRNPMTALKGFIQLLEGSVKEDFSMYFNIITSELKRIESIITEFLILSKPQAIQFEEKDVVKIMRDTIDLLNAQAIIANVQIELYIPETIPAIYCEPNQLKQVFINILKNAIEVMQDGGTIIVSIKSHEDHHVIISIKDQGSGIPEDKLKRLGEPFYTTKERGTGLGLMVSYKIIEEHCGAVEVESEVGEGTTFHLKLPVHQHHNN
ncbi:PAS domain-containing sensor histidine kinase [Metabacillus arenae]|uniref:histidine kinase n=1 Tax=Metabacillus arenae TaxID=2771434 RepID=A0A926NGG5_9BACI|nr:PAS domain-containing sensor histidine kinase [Metabacillus arenae]MBD1380355.1 PAS domain S-box protein [Metabacillus arenae]